MRAALRVIGAAAGLLWAGAAAAEAPELKLSGSVRARYEAITGQPRAGFQSDDDLFNLRTILTAEYGAKPLGVVLEMYDSRAWGAEPRTPLTTGEVNALELVQAYVAAHTDHLAGTAVSASAQGGRFLLNLGSRRLVAADDYRNTTSGYTGVRVDLARAGRWGATLVYVLPQIRLPDDAAALRDNRARVDEETDDLALWGGLADVKLGRDTLEVSGFGFRERDAPGRPTRDRDLATVGARLIREPGPRGFDYELEAYAQTGRTSEGLSAAEPRLPVRAGFVHAEAGWATGDRAHSHWALDFDYATGDRPGRSFGRFDTLFGQRRADFSPAGLYTAVTRTNIVAPGVRYDAAPGPRWDVLATYKPMWLASRTDAFGTTGVRDPAGRSGRFAGHQLDGRLRWWAVPKRLRLEADATVLLKGRFLRNAPNAPDGDDTGYLSLNATAFF